jgi:hypothetical protein
MTDTIWIYMPASETEHEFDEHGACENCGGVRGMMGLRPGCWTKGGWQSNQRGIMLGCQFVERPIEPLHFKVWSTVGARRVTEQYSWSAVEP